MVGIMRAGAAYVPLDPKLPSDRLKFLVEQCSCHSSVGQKRFESLMRGFQTQQLLIFEECLGRSQLTCRANSSTPQSSPVPESIAYVLFTSGSTGKPKGVMVAQASTSVATQANSGASHATCSTRGRLAA